MPHKLIAVLSLALCSSALAQTTKPPSLSYRIVDTGQKVIFSDAGQLLKAPKPSEPFFGQDAFYEGPQPSYRDNHDGTVSDLNTGLVWLKTPVKDKKLTFAQAKEEAAKCRTAGYDDWRLPTIKELYSLIDFNGNSRAAKPKAYIDTKHFDFRFGTGTAEERTIDSQYWSSTQYVGRTMRDNATVFGVNFADGRIKGYPRDTSRGGEPMRQYVRLVRGNVKYGQNRFVDNHDGTISDLATGLMWDKEDSRKAMNWEDSLAWCHKLKLADHDDWRLPSVKELQSIVDYTRAPDAAARSHQGPAIDPVFKITDDEAWFWSSTTHLEGPGGQGKAAAYIAFGRAMGTMHGRKMNVHGAGAQRSDPKSGDPHDRRWSEGLGPQGDEIRILNYARAVRNIAPDTVKLVQPDLTPLPKSSRPAGPRGEGAAGDGRPGDGPPPLDPPPE